MTNATIQINLRHFLTPKAAKMVDGKIVTGITREDYNSYHQYLEWRLIFERIDHCYSQIMLRRYQTYISN